MLSVGMRVRVRDGIGEGADTLPGEIIGIGGSLWTGELYYVMVGGLCRMYYARDLVFVRG